LKCRFNTIKKPVMQWYT